MVILGKARRAHLSEVRRLMQHDVRKLVQKHASHLSYAEVHHQLLLALEDYARDPAEEIRRRGNEIAAKHCGEQQ